MQHRTGKAMVLLLVTTVVGTFLFLRSSATGANMSSVNQVATSNSSLELSHSRSPVYPKTASTPATPPGVSAASHPGGGKVTVADIKQYAATHRLDKDISGSQVYNVTQVTLRSIADIESSLGGAKTGMPSTKMLWDVELQGTFVFPGPPGAGTFTYTHVFELFDPDSGNLIMVAAS
jgi:hypothetical protein